MIIIFSFGCKKQDASQAPSQESIVGFWVNPQYNDSTILFKRADQLIKDDVGLAIYNDYKLTERQNSSWCGTPPITYGDYGGKWSKVGNELTINVGFWGGVAVKKWQILAVTDQQLEVYVLEEIFLE